MFDGLSSGFRLRYELVECLGSGAMGTVFRGRQLALHREVALKLLRLDPESDHGRRFSAEAKLLATLTHPGIVRIFDYGWDSSIPYLVMELVEGGTLRAELRTRGKLPLEDAVEILLEVLDAVAYLHERDVVHRDIKPENILLDAAGQPRVADFGLALDTRSTMTRMTEDGHVMGTARYMAPELFEGNTFCPATDLYAIGVMLFELLTGAPPFDAQDGPRMVHAKMSGKLWRLRDVEPSMPEALDDLLARLLDRRPPVRPETARELAAELGALIPGAAGAVVSVPAVAEGASAAAGTVAGATPEPGARAAARPGRPRCEPKPLAVRVSGPPNDTAAVRRRSLRALLGFFAFVAIVAVGTVIASRPRHPPAAAGSPSFAESASVAPPSASAPVEPVRGQLDEALAVFDARRRHVEIARAWLEKKRGSGDTALKVGWLKSELTKLVDGARRVNLVNKIVAYRDARSALARAPATAELRTYIALQDLMNLEQFLRQAGGDGTAAPSLGKEVADPLPEPWREQERSRLVPRAAIALECIDRIHRRRREWPWTVARQDGWGGAGFRTRLLTSAGTIPGEDLVDEEESTARLIYDHPAPLALPPSRAAEIALVGSDKGHGHVAFQVSIEGQGGWQTVAVFRTLDNRPRFVAVDPTLVAGRSRLRVEMRPVDGLHVHYRANLFGLAVASGEARPPGH